MRNQVALHPFLAILYVAVLAIGCAQKASAFYEIVATRRQLAAQKRSIPCAACADKLASEMRRFLAPIGVLVMLVVPDRFPSAFPVRFRLTPDVVSAVALAVEVDADPVAILAELRAARAALADAALRCDVSPGRCSSTCRCPTCRWHDAVVLRSAMATVPCGC